MDHDVIIIGGSYAGLSAALPLARARRSVLVVDAGLRRNRFAAASHGFLTRDGTPPGEIAAIGRRQLMAYGTVRWIDGQALQAQGQADAFAVTLQDGTRHTGRRLVLASGMVDVLPDVPGLPERWGRQVFHCPYCHGYELMQGKVGVLATSEMSWHQAMMLPEWGATTLFLNDAASFEGEERQALKARGVAIVAGKVARLKGDDAALLLVLRDGRPFEMAGLFVATRLTPGPLAAQLGCQLEEGPMGPSVKTDAFKHTTVPGVFACGDVARQAGSVPLAVGDGALAGAATHRTLMFGL